MRSHIVFAALSASVALAQNTLQNFTFDINQVSPTLRAQWCLAQFNTCNTLCAKNPKANTCDQNTLIYSCSCQNGSAPGLQYYVDTIYTNTCQESFHECIVANQNNATGQEECKDNIESKCGTLNANNANIATSTSAASSAASTTAGPQSTGASAAATTAATSTSHNAAPTAMVIGNGAAVMAAGLFAAALF